MFPSCRTSVPRELHPPHFAVHNPANGRMHTLWLKESSGLSEKCQAFTIPSTHTLPPSILDALSHSMQALCRRGSGFVFLNSSAAHHAAASTSPCRASAATDTHIVAGQPTKSTAPTAHQTGAHHHLARAWSGHTFVAIKAGKFILKVEVKHPSASVPQPPFPLPSQPSCCYVKGVAAYRQTEWAWKGWQGRSNGAP